MGDDLRERIARAAADHAEVELDDDHSVHPLRSDRAERRERNAMRDVNEVPTYRPPAGVNGPTLGRDLPDGCERCLAHADPRDGDYWLAWHDGDRMSDLLYWWRPVPLQVGDRVQLTGTVEDVGSVAAVRIDGAGHRPYSFPTEALTRVVDQ